MTGKPDSDNPQDDQNEGSESVPSFDDTFVMDDRVQPEPTEASAGDSGENTDQQDNFESTVVFPSKSAEVPPENAIDNEQEDSSKSGVFDRTLVSPPGKSAGNDLDSGATAGESSDNSDAFEKTIMGSVDNPEPEETSKTVVQPNREAASKSDVDATDSMVARTLVSPPGADVDKTQIFTKSMGMRGLTEEEYEQWQKELEEKADSTDTVQKPDDDSVSGRSTQIWSKQSAHGLDNALTIRSRPVGGEGGLASSEDQPDYEIVQKLAEGGMGVVYIARQTSLDRELAIKTLKPLTGREKTQFEQSGRMSQVNQQRREMFLSEALVTANLVHPHIIPIHDLCQTDDGYPFYSMKRVHGVPWSDLLRTMTLDENLEVLLKVADAIAYAHHHGVVNRDLKPENIMLGEFGEVMVLDWGLAVPATEDDRNRFASPAASFGAGTPAYMSPELWTGPPGAIGTWSDVYLMGAMLYEVITGHPPHEFPDPPPGSGNSAVWGIIDSVVRKNTIRETEASGELMDIALKALSSEPNQRHESVVAFQLAVKNYQKHEESRRLTQRADSLVESHNASDKSAGYQDFQTASALYEEAVHAWSENEKARDGLRNTRLSYADLAYRKGDYDLGLQIVAQDEGPDFDTLERQLHRARRVRAGLKWTTLAAFATIVIVGAHSFVQSIRIQRQNEEIRELFGDKRSLEEDKEQLQEEQDALKQETERLVTQTAGLEKEKETLNSEKETLLAEKSSLQKDKSDLELVKMGLETEKTALEGEKEKLVTERDSLVTEKDELQKEKQQLVVDKETLVVDKRQLEQDIERVEEEKLQIAMEVQGLTEQRVRAQVDLKNASIASLIRNADYSTALQRVDSLLEELNSDTLKDLPEQDRKQRIIELEARRRQLLRRARANQTPVQTQAVSTDNKTLVWGHSDGLIEVYGVEGDSFDISQNPIRSHQVQGEVRKLLLSANGETVFVLTPEHLHKWKHDEDQIQTVVSSSGEFTSLAAHRDMILTASDDGTLAARSMDNLQTLWSIQSSTSIRDMIVVPDSDTLVFAGSRGGQSADVLAYQLPSAAEPNSRPERQGQLRLPRNRNYPPRKLGVSPDGQYLLISNSRNGEVLLLPKRTDFSPTARDRFPFEHASDLAESNDAFWIATGHQRPVNDFSFSSNGQRLATASDDRGIGIWEFATSEVGTRQLKFIKRLEGHGARVTSVRFHNNSGNQLTSSSADRYCRSWDLNEYDLEKDQIEQAFELAEQQLHKPHVTRWILTSAASSETEFSDAEIDSEPEYTVLNGQASIQRGALKSAFLSDDGRHAVTGAADGTTVIWDTQTGKPLEAATKHTRFQPESLMSFDEGHDFNVSHLQFLPPDGKTLITTGFDGNLCLWNADSRHAGAGVQRLRIPGLGLVNSFAASADGTILATSSDATDGGVQGICLVWRMSDLLNEPNPRPMAELTGLHKNEITSLAVSHNGSHVVTGARDGRVGLWQTETSTLIASGRLHAKDTIVSHVQLLPNMHVMTTGFDGRMQICHPDDSTNSFQVVSTFEHDRIPIERVSFSPNGQQFISTSVRTDRATNSISYELNLWQISQDHPITRITPAVVEDTQPTTITSVDWSPDGSSVAIVVDQKLQLLETKRWRVQKVLDAPGAGITNAVFAPDNLNKRRQLIATFDGTAAHLWNLEDKQHVMDFRPLFAVTATALAGISSNRMLLTGDRTVRGFIADPSSPDYGRSVFKLPEPHRGVVTSIAAVNSSTPDSVRFASAAADGTATLWNWNADHNTVNRITDFPRNPAGVSELNWSPDHQELLIIYKDGSVHICSTDESEVQSRSFSVDDSQEYELLCGQFSSDGKFLAVAGQTRESGESIGWVFAVDNTQDTQPRLHCTFTGHESGGITCLGFLADSPYLVSGGTDGSVIVWNWQPQLRDQSTQAYEAYQFLAKDSSRAHSAPVNALSVSSDGHVLTACEDGVAVVWKNPFAHQLTR